MDVDLFVGLDQFGIEEATRGGEMGDREEQVEDGGGSSLELEAPIIPVTETEETPISVSDGIAFNNQSEIFRAIEIVERDSLVIAQSFTSLFASLRLALSESTSTSLHHMHCFTDATGRLQESVLDAATKGNRYINSCLRLNEEMKSVDGLASQLKILRKHVDALDTAVNKLLHIP